MKMPRLLMVDDEPDIGSFVRRVAERLDYDMCFTQHAQKFASLYETFHPDVVILDLMMPNTDGIELLQFLAQVESRAHILLMSGFDDSMRQLALRLGEARGLRMVGIVPKPVRAADLRSVLDSIRKELVKDESG